MASLSMLNAHSNSGFYKAPVTKFLVASMTVSHIALQVPALASWQKSLVCKIPECFSRNEWLRILTTKLVFLETKDAIFCILLLYFFRIFERRLGSRKFSSQLFSSVVLTGLTELVLQTTLYTLNTSSRMLFVGPVGLVFPWLVAFFFDVPNLNSSTFGGLPVSSKTMTYILALQVAASSQSHLVGTISALFAGVLHRLNFLWIQNWLVVPRPIGSLFQRCLGWLIESSPPAETMMGATLEIQRAQQMEAIEQQMMMQQVNMARRQRLPGAQGFAERLVDDQWANFQNFNFGGVAPNQHQPQQQQQRRQVEPSDENIRLLSDMGFSVDRARTALLETNNDLQLATTVLLRDS